MARVVIRDYMEIGADTTETLAGTSSGRPPESRGYDCEAPTARLARG